MSIRYAVGAALVGVNLWSILTWESFWQKLDGDKWWYHFLFFTNWVLTISTLYFLYAAYACDDSLGAGKDKEPRRGWGGEDGESRGGE